MSDAVFVSEGDLLIPQSSAIGPWFPGVQHGGAIAGVFARAVERLPSAGPMMTTRLAIDMSRRVPMGPTRVDTDVVRDGKRIQAVECRYVVDDEVVGRATAMRVRIADGISVPNPALPEDEIPSDPETHPVITWTFDGPLDFAASFDFRRTEDDLGRVTGWMKIEKPFVAGEPNDPRILVAAVADMMPSGGSVLDYERMISINSDLVISLSRPPEGEWIGFTAAVRGEGNGYGQADATLFDHRGRIGRALKSLLVDER
ncbi:MAG: thioesterase family protein [Actinomycetota bacterium]